MDSSSTVNLIENGVDPRTVQAVMRHRSADMTLYYATVNEKKKADAIENHK